MKFSHKLGLSAGFALGALIIALIVSVFGLQQAKKRTDYFLQVDQVIYQQESLIYTHGLQTAQAIRNIVMNPNNKMAYEQLNASGEIIEQAAQKLREAAVNDPATLAMISKAIELRHQLQAVHNEVLTNVTNLPWAVDKIAKEETPVWREFRLLLMNSMNERREQMTAAEMELSAYMGRAAWISGLIGLVGAIVGIALITWLGRGILRQLGGDPAEAMAVAQTIARGDFSKPIPVQPDDDQSLMYSMSQMQSSLAQMASEIQQAAETIETAASEISIGNVDLSERTIAQAAGLEQTAASMEEITSTVNLNADNAGEANRLAAQASVLAETSGQAVSSAVNSMDEIRDSSTRIVNIIDVIDSIAFQTNILALNAAVEAARAGEQGRGFAVVASEVRTLAQRSAAAARDIKQLIDTSVQSISLGNDQIISAGDAVNDLVKSIQNVAAIMDEITNASQEQSLGVSQIDLAIRQIDDMTQQNSALVQEATAAAQSLSEQAVRLRATVGRFRLPAGGITTIECSHSPKYLS